MDKRYLAGITDAVVLLVIFFGGIIMYTAVSYNDNIFKMVGSAFITATTIIVYYFYIGNRLYKKLGWLEA